MDNQAAVERQTPSKRHQALLDKYGGEEGLKAHMSEIAARTAAARTINHGGTKEGGRKGHETRKRKYGGEQGLRTHMSEIGRKGAEARWRGREES